jgi:hypothetical protein
MITNSTANVAIVAQATYESRANLPRFAGDGKLTFIAPTGCTVIVRNACACPYTAPAHLVTGPAVPTASIRRQRLRHRRPSRHDTYIHTYIHMTAVHNKSEDAFFDRLRPQPALCPLCSAAYAVVPSCCSAAYAVVPSCCCCCFMLYTDSVIPRSRENTLCHADEVVSSQRGPSSCIT